MKGSSRVVSESETNAVQPFGRYGVGLLTGHPVGSVVAAGVALITMEAIPASRWFVAGSLVVGGAFGFFLWLHHR